MFNFFHRKLKKNLLSLKGQVAIILVLVAALALIFFAVTLNFGRVTQAKTLTIIASNSAASSMGSFFASYGQRLFAETLGGHEKICGLTELVVIVVTIIVIIIVIIILIVTWGAGWYVVVAAIGLIAAIAALVIYLTVVEPGITSMWNKMMRGSLSTTDRFVEQGIQTGLRNIVTDNVRIPDLEDLDTDALFGLTDPGDPESEALDYISRFAYYNTERIRRIPKIQNDDVVDFVNALRNLIWDNGDAWGLHDPVDCDVIAPGTHPCCPIDPGTDPDFPAFCDSCCVPLNVKDRDGNDFLDAEGNPLRLRPICCDDMIPDPDDPSGINLIPNLDKCGEPTTCWQRTPYFDLATHPLNTYEWVYDRFYENSFNNDPASPVPFISVREALGRDDEHHLYRVTPNMPNWQDRTIERGTANRYVQTLDAANPGFFLQDSSGFYTNPPFPKDDRKEGIYPYFYKMADWGPDLIPCVVGEVDRLDCTDWLVVDADDPRCHWCDPRSATGVCNALPVELIQLQLDPAGLQNFDGAWCVDGFNTAFGGNPILADLVPNTPIFRRPGNCAGGSNGLGGWERGADQFCKPVYPYFSGCAKHGGALGCDDTTVVEGLPMTVTTDCQCGDPAPALPPDQWPDDFLDEFLYGVTEFVAWAQVIVRQDELFLIQTLEDWYPEAAEWIEPACLAPPCANSFTNLAREGALYTWRDELRGFFDPIQEWLEPSAGNEYISAGCTVGVPNTSTEAWCIPPEQTGVPNEFGIDECGCVNPLEQATFDFNANGTRGDLEDVVECLRWNGEDPVIDFQGNPYLVGGIPQFGNAAKFELCFNDCRVEHCTDLPRSLVPDFCNMMPFDDADDPAAAADYRDCLDSTNPAVTPVEECGVDCAGLPDPVVPLPVFIPPNLAQITALTDRLDPASTVCDCITNRGIFNGFCADANGNPDPTVTINCLASPTAFRNDVEAAICQVEGSCCDFPPETCEPGVHSPLVNPFYNAIIGALTGGICGVDWAPNQGNAFFDTVYRALGSCYNSSSDNPFFVPLSGARFGIAIDCATIPGGGTPGVDCDDNDIAVFDACMADILDANGGCPVGSPCETLPQFRESDPTVSYNLWPFERGIVEPELLFGGLCDETFADPAFYDKFENCLWPERCDTANCTNLPQISCNGNPTGIPLVPPAESLAIPCSTPLDVDGDPPTGTCDDSDIALMQACLADCFTNQAECGALNALVNHDGVSYGIPPYVAPDLFTRTFYINNCLASCGPVCENPFLPIPLNCASPTYSSSEMDLCACTWESSCSGWGCGLDTTFFDAVQQALLDAGGDCADQNFLDGLQESALEARNQVAKFRHRRQFLENRMDEAIEIRDFFNQLLTQFDAFLDNATGWPPIDGISERLIDARKNRTAAAPALPSFVVYAWQDEQLDEPRTLPDGRVTFDGYWHAIKVEVRVPRRCNNTCGVGATPDPPWPSIRTYTKHWGFTRCYELENTQGIVKARVIRYDEDTDSSEARFPGGQLIWKSRFFHPDTGVGDPGNLEVACNDQIDPNIRGLPWGKAFMLNIRPDPSQLPLNPGDPGYDEDAKNYALCWEAVHTRMLEHGVGSDTCAQYFFGRGFGRSFRLKFIPCDAGFASGGT